MKTPSFYSDPHVQFLSQLLEEIGDGGIQVPRFQRPMVWNWERRLELLRSIRDGIPIGAIMVWRTSTVVIDCYEKLGPHVLRIPPVGATRQYLLDGVQRLSTLYGALHRPTQQESSELEEQPEIDEGLAIDDESGPSKTMSFDVYFDPIKNDFVSPDLTDSYDSGSLMPIALVFDSVSLLRYQRTISEGAIKSIDELARSFRDYKLPVIPITTDDINLATRTFQRINSQGARMSETHMVHALTWQPGFDLQNRLAELKAAYLAERGWGALDNDPILKACKAACGLDVYKASADELSKELTSNPHILESVFKSIARSADFLWNTCGLGSPDLVPYALQIVVLSEAFRVRPEPSEQIRQLLFSWLWVTTYGELFAGMSGDRVQVAIADMHKTVSAGKGTWTWRRPFELRPLRSTFDFRAARAKAFAFRLAAVQDDVDGNRGGTMILADSGRKALAQVLPWSNATRSAYSSPGNRFLVHPADLAEFRDRILTCNLTEEDRARHTISETSHHLLKEHDFSGFVEQRSQDIQEKEHAFVAPLVAQYNDLY